MRFMVLVKGNAKSEAGILPDEKELSDMGTFNQQMQSAGVMLAGEGLKATAHGFRVRQTGKKVTVIDGPFTEAKEVIAGFWIIKVASKAEAIDWIKRVPHTEGEIELRPLYELSDFPVDASEQDAGWREQEEKFRDQGDAAGAAAAPPPRLPGTTRYLVALRGDAATESGALPTPQALEQMGALMTELAQTGAFLSGDGLKPSATGTRIRFDGARRTITDGPFSETKELIAGYTIIQVKSRDEALAFARRWLQIHIATSRVPLEESELEVRPLFELTDFPVSPAEKPDGWRQQEQAARDRQR